MIYNKENDITYGNLEANRVQIFYTSEKVRRRRKRMVEK